MKYNSFHKNIFYIFIIAILILIVVPASFASDDVNETSIGIDEHGENDGYILFEKDTISVGENESTVIEGTVYWYEDQVAYCDLNLECSYVDFNGITRTYRTYWDSYAYDYGLQFDTSQCEGLNPRSEPYILTFTAVEDDLYDDYLMYSDGLVPSWLSLYVATPIPVGPIDPNVTFENQIYVSVNGSDDTGNGSWDNPYATISKALDVNNGTSEIIVSEGTYHLSKYYNNKQVAITGIGEVIITADDNYYHILASGYYNKFQNMIFIDGDGSIDLSSANVGSIVGTSVINGGDRYLIFKNCTFINNFGFVGAIKTHTNTLIEGCTFLNNTAIGYSDNFRGLISACEGRIIINSSIFVNNRIYYDNPIVFSNNDDVIGNVNYNFWGINEDPNNLRSSNMGYENWVGITASSNSTHVVGEISEILIEFKLTNDGVSFSDLEFIMPDLIVNLNSDSGILNKTSVRLSNNKALVNFTPSKRGLNTINVVVANNVVYTLEINADVPEVDKIYVSPNGSDNNLGSQDSPVKTVGEAVSRNYEFGGGKTIILMEGSYEEQDLMIMSPLVIIGENATLSTNNLSVGADVDIYNLTVVSSSVNQRGNMELNGVNLVDSNLNSVYPLNITDSVFMNVICKITDTTLVNHTIFEGSTINTFAADIIIVSSLFDLKSSLFIRDHGHALISNNDFNSSSIIGDYSEMLIDSNEFDNSTIAVYSNVANITNNDFINNVDYAISLIGVNATLENNTISSNKAIFVNESYVSNLILTFINNETVKVKNGTIQLNATVTDDMGNAVDGGLITFTSNGEVIGNASNNITYEFGTGDYVISGSYSNSLGELKVNDGLLRVNVKNYWFINETGYETLQEAVDAAEINDVIKGVSGVHEIGIIDIGHRTRPAEPWVINKNITITSMDEEKITLKAIDRYMFYIDYYSNVTFENIIFTGGNNPTGWGGAVSSMGKNIITINNCLFIDNFAEEGGAINGWGKLCIKDTDFINNTASVFGGAIYKDGDGDFLMENVRFINNSAYTYAGAFYSMGYSEVTQIFKDVLFDNNDATCGGAIFAHGKNMTFIDCNFTNNRAVDKLSGYDPMGGAVYAHNALTRFYNVNFINNTAEGNGGALELDNSILSTVDSEGRHQTIHWAILENCTIFNNTATGDGGAIYTGDALVTHVNITNTLILNNTAADGAGFVNLFGFYTLNNVTFENNRNTLGDTLIYTYGMYSFPESFYANTTIINTRFINNDVYSVIKPTTEYANVFIINSTFESQKVILDNYVSSVFMQSNREINPVGDYSIENNGVLALDNNSFINPILNKLLITTPAYLVILDNKTVQANYMDTVLLNASIFDDNGNAIVCNNLEFWINGSKVTAMLIDDVFFANYTVNSSGIVNAMFGCDFDDLTIETGAITINNTANIKYDVENVHVCEDVILNVSLPVYATGNVTVTVNTNKYSETLDGGKATFKISNLTAGSYVAYIYYLGDSIYGPNNITAEFNVLKIDDYTINITCSNATVGDDLIFNITLPEGAEGEVTLIIDGRNYTATNSTIVVPDLEAGNYTAIFKYSGDDTYDSKIIELNVTVNDIDFRVYVDDLEKYCKGPEKFVVNITDNKGNPLANESVQISINGVDYTRITNENGTASMNINFNAGVYPAVVSYNNYTFNRTITVKATVYGNNVTKMFRNDTQYYATFLDSQGNPLANGTEVEFNINGVMYKRQVSGSEGKARLNINLVAGEYIITAINTNGDMNSNIIKVLPTIADNKNVTKYFRNDTQYYVTILDNQGNPVGAGVDVTFNINGVMYKRQTNESGVARLNLNLNPGDYIITAMYNGCVVSNTVKILPVLSASDLNMHVRDGSKFEAKLVDGQGNALSGVYVEFNINGVLYKRLTDVDGIARLNINLVQGKYIITSSYNGSPISNTITIN